MICSLFAVSYSFSFSKNELSSAGPAPILAQLSPPQPQSQPELPPTEFSPPLSPSSDEINGGNNISSPASSSEAQSLISNTFLTYENPTLGLKVQYPSDWDKSEAPDVVTFLSPTSASQSANNNNITQSLVTPQEQQPPFREALSISAQGNTSSDTLTDFVNNTISSLQSISQDLQILESSPAELKVTSGNMTIPAHRAVYTWKNPQANNADFKTMEYYAMSDGKEYIITYGARSNMYDVYLPTIQKMIDSLQLVSLSPEIQNNTLDNATFGSNMSEGASTNMTTTPASPSQGQVLLPAEISPPSNNITTNPESAPPPPSSAELPSSSLQNNTVTSAVINRSSNFLTYENSTYGIEVKYPADWDYYESAKFGGLYDIAVFQAPLESRTDPYSATFSISTDVLEDQSQSLDEYVDEIIPSFTESQRKVVESDVDDGFTLAGRPAYQLVSTYALNGTNFRTLETGTIVDDKVYVIQYDAKDSKYQEYLPTAQEMINSFQITDSES